MPPLLHILCARPPPPAKSKATLGSLSAAAAMSRDASCKLDYANNAPAKPQPRLQEDKDGSGDRQDAA
jgi:hypothetical protein